ncbi:MAG: molybdopterin molybdotransferase MoeA [Rhodospirillaceae bacterium]|nr:MAG: molybdopterin molybdotransferase MoeA [Rhodospirillaceae bacterium]
MVQLSNDCFASSSAMMAIEDAIALATSRLPVLVAIETVSLDRADGRIAAEDIFARNDLPPFANSAVDGYAVRHADLAEGAETTLPIAGRLKAGETETISAAKRAVRIFTGAPMPWDADTVFMQEDVHVDGGTVCLPAGLKAGANMRPPGEDIAEFERIIPAGRRLRPQDIALAAATGHKYLPVRRPLRVAVFSTGDELIKPGSRLKPGTIYDSNRVMLIALLGRLGAHVRNFGILPDDAKVLKTRLSEVAEDNDLILTSGGVSLGEEDHVRSAIEATGQLVFWRLAIKPGRPLAMGMVNGTPLVGLPGNPAAVYVTFVNFVRPLIAHLSGAVLDPIEPLLVRSAFAQKKRPGRREYVRVNVSQAADGVLEARRFPKEGAALLTSLTTSDGIAEIADDVTAVAVGDMINFFPHAVFW